MSNAMDKIMYESGLTASGCWDEMDSYDKEAIMKFSSLIVKKCITIIENLPSGYKDYRDQIEDAFRRDCIEEIKHHFEVKEL